MRLCAKLLLPLISASLFGVQFVAQTVPPHPYTVKDWIASRSAYPLDLSPDGSEILSSVTYGADVGPSKHEYWQLHPDGSAAHKLTLPNGFSPEGYMPDGHALYGHYKVNGEGQLAVFALSGDAAAEAPTTLVALARGVEAIVPSPDGHRFAILADPRPVDSLAATRTVVEPEETSLYLVNIDGTGGHWACSKLTRIAGGEGSSTPPIAWSADSKQIALVTSESKIDHHNTSSSVALCSVADETAKAKVLTTIANSISSVAFSGPAEVAFLSTPSPTLTPDHLYTVAISGGAATDRTPELPITLGALVGDAQGNVFVQLQHGVRNEVGLWKDGKLSTAYTWPDGVVGLPTASPYAASSSQLAFAVGDPTHAGNIATIAADHKTLSRITHEADSELAAVTLGEVKVVHWMTTDGTPIEAIATFPAGFQAGKRYPFLVLPHGGPEASDELRLDPFSRTIAGLGYIVLQPEYRGSTGYGDAHMAAIYQHFGDRAYSDVDSATDYAIAQGWADPHRLAIFGWSAGGFMTSWTVTQTHRYKAAIEGAGITDWASFIFTSDVAQTDFDARWPEEDPQAFARFSAVDFARQVTTPLLILHGEADIRVPTYQGLEFYEVLAARGKTVRLVTYPGSPHFPGQWQQRVNIFDEIAAWLAKYNPPS